MSNQYLSQISSLILGISAYMFLGTPSLAAPAPFQQTKTSFQNSEYLQEFYRLANKIDPINSGYEGMFKDQKDYEQYKKDLSALQQKVMDSGTCEELMRFAILHQVFAEFDSCQQVLQLVLEKKKRQPIPDCNHLPILHLSIKFNASALIGHLLRFQNANVNEQESKDGTAPLHMAIMYNNKDAVLLDKKSIVLHLIKRKKIEVNIQDKQKRTPLHLACMALCIVNNHHSIEELLKHPKIQVNLLTADNQTALDILYESNKALHAAPKGLSKNSKQDILKTRDLLLKHGAKYHKYKDQVLTWA